ncbi:nucleoside 2-deoxyribosyltransferase [Methanosphaerula palustris]|uniref:Nucleoside 2-deoxyribosyltransferase n=1 Tax=Methanosphaerula palustris (strain ATCC BAA-1556 / DSM 19958 / E1-9c) TaxID=521011 RepID=B8GGC4_METPE|nr:nucleoside 2-deoxyribosyltransferase [Methanosphaerula palustris]ACL18042.1 nucleoside 2-deoxyribosyltransferase [Methanosphaerula palustris E1-9c]
MYVLVCPCILDPSFRARGITDEEDRLWFTKVRARCETLGIEMVPLPCPETIHLGWDRKPGTFLERLDTPAFAALLARLERKIRALIRVRGPPLCIVGVNSSPTCGVDRTYYGGDPPKRSGPGVWLARFPDIPVYDVTSFGRYRVYLAAPLFSEGERMYNRLVRDQLVRAGQQVHLPQEIGDDFSSRDLGITRVIFSENLNVLRDSDLVVAVIDGADTDSGTAWEVGYAYACGIPVVALRTDFRSVGVDERVNLMLEQSAVVVTDRKDLVSHLSSPLMLFSGPDETAETVRSTL